MTHPSVPMRTILESPVIMPVSWMILITNMDASLFSNVATNYGSLRIMLLKSYKS